MAKNKFNFQRSLARTGLGAAGFVGAAWLDKIPWVAKQDPKWVGLGKIILGTLGPEAAQYIFGTKNIKAGTYQIMQDVGSGIANVGVAQFGHVIAPDIVPGVKGLMPTMEGRRRLNGTRPNVMNGTRPNVMNGRRTAVLQM